MIYCKGQGINKMRKYENEFDNRVEGHPVHLPIEEDREVYLSIGGD